MKCFLREAAAAILVAECLSIAGCPDPSAWELKGEVEFIEFRESVDAQGLKSASLDYSIRNQGRSTIEGSSIAFTFSTDKNKYHHTVTNESAIRAGALVYGQVSIVYNRAEEVGALAGAVVDSVQFK